MKTHTRRRRLSIAVGVMSILMLASCSPADVSTADSFTTIENRSPRAGRDVPGARLSQLYRQSNWDDPAEPAVLVQLWSTDDMDQLPTGLSAVTRDLIDTLVREADGTRVIVVGSYGNCQMHSGVVYGDEPGTVTFVVEADNEEGTVACVWTPAAIDAWSVPIEAFTT